jgi:hypothetical protein
MRRKRIVAFVGLAVVAGIVGAVAAQLLEGVPYQLASVNDLTQYPLLLSPEMTPMAERLYTLILPDTDRSIVLRPLPETEYGSYQVQAIAAEMIDQQMLAATIVLPVVSEAEIAAFNPGLVALLEQAVNQISGYTVFSGVP